MDDAGIGRDDAEVIEGLLTPAQERIAFLVPGELQRRIQISGIPLGIVVDLDGVVDHELDRLEGVDLGRVATQPDNTVTHGRKVHNRRDACEILEQHASWREGDLLLHPAGTSQCPGPDVLGIDKAAVLPPQQVLEQDLQRIRQPRELETRRARAPEG